MPFPLPWSAYALARTAGLLSVAAFAGSAVTNAVASRLLVSDDALAAVDTLESVGLASPADAKLDAKAEARERQLEAALAAQAKTQAQAGTELITERNIFCPDCQPAPGGSADGSEDGDAEPAMELTQLPLALVATMESEEPIDSLATIRDTERQTTGLFGIGDPVRPGVLVAGIQQGSVVLRGRGGLQTLGFPDPRKPEPKKKPKKKDKKKKKKKSSREIDGARDAIDCEGNACTVDRAFVEKLMRNPRMLAKQAKLIPAVKDGQTRGFRVYRALKGTLPQLLGLKNGDTLLAVNGNDLDSMDEAISLYTKLRRASELSLTVERKGKVFDKQISIR